MDKIYFKSKEDYDLYVKEHQGTTYRRYYFSVPEKFPCVGIQTWSPLGELGLRYLMEDFVYLSDF